MKNLIAIVSSLLLVTVVSCKSHKATVIRASGPGIRVENSVKVPSGKASDPKFSNNEKLGDALVKAARTWIGTPYRYGGQSKSGTDCSGMMMVIYKDVAGLALPRTAAQQEEYCFDIPRRDLQPGDLVFFSTSSRGGKVSHVGMYVGNGKMIHASTSRGVIESGLDEKYYVNHYHSSGRVYGITNVATGGKQSSKDKPSADKAAASSAASTHRPASQTSGQTKQSSGAKSPGGVTEMTLDQFVAMKRKPLRDTVVVAEHVISRAVAAMDSASAMLDSINDVRTVPEMPTANIDGPTEIVDGKRQPVRAVKVADADTTATVREVPDMPNANINGPTVIVNGKRVPVTAVEKKRVEKTDSVVPDSVRQSQEIRATVVKAMKFGK